MRIVILFAIATLAVFAQVSGVPVEGVVVNQADHTGVPAATVTFFTKDGAVYHASTDASGAFRIADMQAGEYSAVIEKRGFVVFPKDKAKIENPNSESAPVRIRYEMQFGASPQASLTGRVLDNKEQPLALAQIALIHGPQDWTLTTSNQDGRFAFPQVVPGTYKILAIPPPRASGSGQPKPRVEEVATYFPSSIDDSRAQRIVIRGTADIDGLRIQTAPVVRVNGVVQNENGTPAPNVSVRLVPILIQPPHVIASFDPYFIPTAEGPGPGPEEAHAVTHDDGAFEFPSVRSGNWSVVAELPPAIDAKSGFNSAPSGVATFRVGDADVTSVRIRLTPPFPITGTARWNLSCVEGRLSCGERPAAGAIFPIWLHTTDGQLSGLNLGTVHQDGTLLIGGVRAGSSWLNFLPPIESDQFLSGVTPRLLQDQRGTLNPYSEPISLRASVALSEGGPVILNEDHPVDRSALSLRSAMSATVQGTVEDGAGAAVVFLPVQLTPGSRGALVYCKPDGTFEARGLAGDSYYVAAYQNLDFEGLRDPDLIRRTVDAAVKINVSSIRPSSELKLKAVRWLE
jgi:hypothetical protein